jgi:hypothetical protein
MKARQLWQHLSCGCQPDRSYSCRQHRFQKQVESRLLWRYLRGDGKYGDFKNAHDKRMTHHRSST